MLACSDVRRLRTRRVADAIIALDEQTTMAARAELDGECQADRTGTDNQDG
jgi:hypothetical protein